QGVDDLGPVPERPGPAVGEDQRRRVRADPGPAHEVHRHALDLDAVVLVGVDPSLGLAPVVVGPPVVDELLQVGAVHAVVPVLVARVVRPRGSASASAGTAGPRHPGMGQARGASSSPGAEQAYLRGEPQPARPFVRVTSAYQRALSFGVRSRVWKSTWMSPKRLE